VARRKAVARPVTRRTAARRAKRHEAAVIAKDAAKKPTEPEGLGQVRVWDRKKKRYLIAGLCERCAAQAAWGHAIGFGKIEKPCSVCQPLVNEFPDEGPKGSPWRKVLIKLEYLSEAEVKEVLA
jgi:hypothetical protein